MAWIESHTVLIRHRKLIELSDDLGIRRSHLMGHLHSLWHSALEQQEDGDLSKWSDRMIARACDFEGDIGNWVLKLSEHGWLNPDRKIHDWWDYAGPYLRSKYKRSPEKWERIRNLYVTGTYRDTKPNLTNQPNLTKPTEVALSPTDSAPILVFPTLGKDKKWELSDSTLQSLKQAFPHLDVLSESRKALAWCECNPSRQKTGRGMPKFLFSWMERTQNRNGGGQGARGKAIAGCATPNRNDKYDRLTIRP